MAPTPRDGVGEGKYSVSSSESSSASSSDGEGAGAGSGDGEEDGGGESGGERETASGDGVGDGDGDGEGEGEGEGEECDSGEEEDGGRGECAGASRSGELAGECAGASRSGELAGDGEGEECDSGEEEVDGGRGECAGDSRSGEVADDGESSCARKSSTFRRHIVRMTIKHSFFSMAMAIRSLIVLYITSEANMARIKTSLIKMSMGECVFWPCCLYERERGTENQERGRMNEGEDASIHVCHIIQLTTYSNRCILIMSFLDLPLFCLMIFLLPCRTH
ncbi:hypothetical protein N665_0656s0006 [Sinapis alba]|nr:hypothetical protein N665_0656s0006 [Sinapis alba]